MDESQRLHLEKMIKENNVEETTGKIRELKHSQLIKRDVDIFLSLKKKYSRLLKTNKQQFTNIVQMQCKFLFTNYTNLFNRLLKDELNLKILAMLLMILKRIEDGELDQHEGSYEVEKLLKKDFLPSGKILKELYVDSALRKEKIKTSKRKRHRKKKSKKEKTHAKLTWSEYKQLHLKQN